MNGKKILRFSLLISACMLVYTTQASAGQITGFYYTSSPSSWVGYGETVTVLPGDGFVFSVSRNFDRGVSFAINDFASNPDPYAERWWYLDFAAPLNKPLQVGHYADATRFPFQDPDSPGLAFYGNGRGSNELTGYFDILEVSYGPFGGVTSFAANFMQYDENQTDWWNSGSIRYKSNVPLEATANVTEPQTLGLIFIGAIILRRHLSIRTQARR